MFRVGANGGNKSCEAGFREWAKSSSEEACCYEMDLAADEFALGGCRQGAPATGRCRCRRTDRPIRAERLDLVAKRRATVLFLVKLEPLKEP